jgi:hypothetical protein
MRTAPLISQKNVPFFCQLPPGGSLERYRARRIFDAMNLSQGGGFDAVHHFSAW